MMIISDNNDYDDDYCSGEDGDLLRDDGESDEANLTS